MPIPQRIAAVPNRIGQDFGSAPPGHKFLIYFKGWQAGNYAPWKAAKSDAQDRETKKREEAEISRQRAEMLREVCPLGDGVTLVDYLRTRQQVLAVSYPEALTIPATSTAPFATGLGNEHPIENSFSFLTPYGLPYLAGSGVKGVLRRAAEEMSLFPEEYAIAAEAAPTLLDVWWLFGFEGAAGAVWKRDTQQAHTFAESLPSLAAHGGLRDFIVRALSDKKERADYLGNDQANGLDFLNRLVADRTFRQSIHTRGALEFWDVFPQPPREEPYKDKLTVEIMTPHYSDYYQKKTSPAYPNGATPHDAGQPNPIFFLAVPVGSTFDFHVVCHSAYLPETLRERWRPMLETIFHHAFDWLGFGAKTAVGYGAMKRDKSREETFRKESEERVRQAAATAEAQRKEGERQAKLAALDPLEREIEELLIDRPDKNQSEMSCLINAVKQGRWSGDAKRRAAEKLRNMMQQGRLWKETSQAKKPEKDRDYQNTLLVMSWLSGE